MLKLLRENDCFASGNSVGNLVMVFDCSLLACVMSVSCPFRLLFDNYFFCFPSKLSLSVVAWAVALL